MLNLGSGTAGFTRLDAGPRIFLNHELRFGEFRETASFRHPVSSNVPLSITRPLSNTRMRVALRMVESRCAITNVVRPFITSSRAALTLASVTASSALVASSRIRIGEILQQCARDREPLPLAAGQHPSALAGIGLKSLLVALDEFQRLRAAGCDPHLLLGRVRLADAQIVRNQSG